MSPRMFNLSLATPSSNEMCLPPSHTEMNLLVISLLAVASMSMLPSQVDGGAPVSTNVKSAAAAVPLGEIWQEDDREVLIRNERGAKNKDAQTGTASGKKGGKNRKNKSKDPNPNHGLHKHPKQNHEHATSPFEQNRKDPISFT